jgi:hypothetical protein
MNNSKKKAKQFAIQYGMSVRQYNGLNDKQKQLLLVANNKMVFTAEEQLLCSFMLANNNSPEQLKQQILALALQKDVDSSAIYKQFGLWQAKLVSTLNEAARRDGSVFSRNLQPFTTDSFPVEGGLFYDFLVKRCAVNDSMSISDRWRSGRYNALVKAAEAALKKIQLLLNTHNNMVIKKQLKASKAV